MNNKPDTGADPLPDGTHRMYPSGDIVDWNERVKRLTYLTRSERINDCMARSWGWIEQAQGGKLRRNK